MIYLKKREIDPLIPLIFHPYDVVTREEESFLDPKTFYHTFLRMRLNVYGLKAMSS